MNITIGEEIIIKQSSLCELVLLKSRCNIFKYISLRDTYIYIELIIVTTGIAFININIYINITSIPRCHNRFFDLYRNLMVRAGRRLSCLRSRNFFDYIRVVL